jgi:FAD/FMN-containing dehydrogenase
MRRRHVLQIAALAGVAGAAGGACRPTGGDQGGVPTVAGPPTSTPSARPTSAPASPSPRPAGIDLVGLRRQVTGAVLVPGDEGYEAWSRPYNAALGRRRPAVIVRASNVADVATCVRRTGGRGLRLAARSGGHSYEGWSTPDRGVVLDLSGLRQIRVRPDGTAVVGAGALLIDVYAALAAAGRALPAGSCPSVGIGGLTLGGGIGVLCRAYGLTCDRLRAADVVTADGEVRRVDTNRDADLFWALRGGGGGNAGVVTAFTFDTVPAPDMSVFSLSFPAARTAKVLAAWQGWMATAPDALWSLCGVTAASEPTNRVSGTWVGRPGGLDRQVADLVAAVGVSPIRRFTSRLGYLEAMRYFAGCSRRSVAACHPSTRPGGTLGRNGFRAASRMLERPLDTRTAAGVVDLVRDRTAIVLLFDALRGAVGQVGSAETAFAHRGALASVQVYSGAAGAAAVGRVQRRLAPLVGRGAYANYINADQADWARAYYAGNGQRLSEIARRYDPYGVFDFPQSALRAGGPSAR